MVTFLYGLVVEAITLNVLVSTKLEEVLTEMKLPAFYEVIYITVKFSILHCSIIFYTIFPYREDYYITVQYNEVQYSTLQHIIS